MTQIRIWMISIFIAVPPRIWHLYYKTINKERSKILNCCKYYYYIDRWTSNYCILFPCFYFCIRVLVLSTEQNVTANSGDPLNIETMICHKHSSYKTSESMDCQLSIVSQLVSQHEILSKDIKMNNSTELFAFILILTWIILVSNRI